MAEDISKGCDTAPLKYGHAANHAEVAHDLLCCLHCRGTLCMFTATNCKSHAPTPVFS